MAQNESKEIVHQGRTHWLQIFEGQVVLSASRGHSNVCLNSGLRLFQLIADMAGGINAVIKTPRAQQERFLSEAHTHTHVHTQRPHHHSVQPNTKRTVVWRMY